MSATRVVLLVELPGGDVAAVLFPSRESADLWEERHGYEVVGRPAVVTARSLSISERVRARSDCATRQPGTTTNPN